MNIRAGTIQMMVKTNNNKHTTHFFHYTSNKYAYICLHVKTLYVDAFVNEILATNVDDGFLLNISLSS